VDAVILRHWIARSDDEPNGQRFFHPVVRFETEDGSKVISISNWGSWRKPGAVGSVVQVRYNPSNPRWAEINCVANVWGIPLTVLGLLAAFILMTWLVAL
jgi:hypothetical protein